MWEGKGRSIQENKERKFNKFGISVEKIEKEITKKKTWDIKKKIRKEEKENKIEERERK